MSSTQTASIKTTFARQLTLAALTCITLIIAPMTYAASTHQKIPSAATQQKILSATSKCLAVVTNEANRMCIKPDFDSNPSLSKRELQEIAQRNACATGIKSGHAYKICLSCTTDAAKNSNSKNLINQCVNTFKRNFIPK